MGTRSSIAMEHPDGSITSIYCHSDGYISHNGKILFESYGQEKLTQLLALGDISSLGPNIGEKHDFDNPPRDDVNAYGRDRGETGTDIEPLTSDSRRKWLKETGQEYNYLLDKHGVWWVSRGWESDGRLDFHSLQAKLKGDSE